MFSEEKFQKLQISKLENLYADDIKEFIRAKEQIFGMFDGGDRARFFRTGEMDARDIVRELNVIMRSYKLPFFCYDFGELKGANLKLTSFIEGQNE